MFKKTLLSAAALLAAGTLSASVFAAPVTAEGTGVGKHGDITVAVTFDAGKIQDIKIVKNAENPILAKKVFTDLKDQVVALSSTDVDLISGATFSAKGFIDAVNDAAKKAGVTLAKADKKALKKAARELPNLQLKGLQMHIGSQLTQAKPFLEAVRKVAPLAAALKEKHGIEFFSIGGGIGIVYQDTLDSGVKEWWNEDCAQLTLSTYAQAVVPTLQPLGLHIIVEPGRLIVGNAGALITRCLYEKTGKAKTFTIVDAGMNDLIRPALYQGYHEIIPVREHLSESCITTDIVGPICESGDFLAQNRDMTDVRQGELLAVLSAGAYGFSMSSNYNSRPMAEEVLVDGNQWNVIRSRQTWEDLIRGESIPE